jgi:thymidylate synthase (FAD)
MTEEIEMLVPTARLIAVTDPLDFDTAEDLLSYVARVSNPKNQENFKTSKKLLEYLMENQHWSPFEMVNMVIELEITRDIGRQILRHRSSAFQEFSQRYADPTQSLGFALREPRFQDTKNRQNSIDLDMSREDHQNIAAEFLSRQRLHIMASMEHYQWSIDMGIAKEQARVFLPEGLTMSRMYMSASLRSWIHYCQLRMGNGTQKEHQEIAGACWNLIQREFPFLRHFRDAE